MLALLVLLLSCSPASLSLSLSDRCIHRARYTSTRIDNMAHARAPLHCTHHSVSYRVQLTRICNIMMCFDFLTEFTDVPTRGATGVSPALTYRNLSNSPYQRHCLIASSARARAVLSPPLWEWAMGDRGLRKGAGRRKKNLVGHM